MSILRKGWCPSTHHPMETGDGWLVRIYLTQGSVSAAQALAIADLAIRYGNGQIDLTSRANLQIRGVTAEGYMPLFQSLSALGLVEENRPPRSDSSQLLLGVVEGGLSLGLPYGRMDAPMLAWLAAQAGDSIIRFSASRTVFLPGVISQETLEAARQKGFITDADDPRRAIEACPGAPACSSALGDTRTLARSIAERFPLLVSSGKRVHISGCAKGCAYAKEADMVIIAAADGYRLAWNAKADALPQRMYMSAQAAMEALDERL